MSEQITTPTPWLRKPCLDECVHRIHFGNRYPFPCIVLTEERTDCRQKREDLRLYPINDEGRDAATADLEEIETEKRKLQREHLRAEVLAGIQRKECRYCRHFQAHKVFPHIGSFDVCLKRDGLGFTNTSETCDDFDIADRYKKLVAEG